MSSSKNTKYHEQNVVEHWEAERLEAAPFGSQDSAVLGKRALLLLLKRISFPKVRFRAKREIELNLDFSGIYFSKLTYLLN